MIARSILLLIFISFSSGVYSQSECNSNFEVIKIPSVLDGRNEIRVDVNASGSFTCDLVAYSGAEKKLLQSKEGYGSEKILFSNLSADTYYRVIVTFQDEEQFLCREKIIDTINLRSNN